MALGLELVWFEPPRGWWLQLGLRKEKRVCQSLRQSGLVFCQREGWLRGLLSGLAAPELRGPSAGLLGPVVAAGGLEEVEQVMVETWHLKVSADTRGPVGPAPG